MLPVLSCLLALAACGSNGHASREPPSPAAGSGSETGPDAPLPAATKGYELYAWDDGGELRFTLVTGTNRTKTAAELTPGESAQQDGDWVLVHRAGWSNLTAVLERVPSGTAIVLSEHPELPSLSEVNRTRVQKALRDAGF